MSNGEILTKIIGWLIAVATGGTVIGLGICAIVNAWDRRKGQKHGKRT